MSKMKEYSKILNIAINLGWGYSSKYSWRSNRQTEGLVVMCIDDFISKQFEKKQERYWRRSSNFYKWRDLFEELLDIFIAIIKIRVMSGGSIQSLFECS